MTDEEIVDSYTQNMGSGPSEAEIDYQCKVQSSNTLNEMSRYKLEIAMCRADAALDCQAKQQAADSCSQMKESPDKVAELLVNNVCRRFVF